MYDSLMPFKDSGTLKAKTKREQEVGIELNNMWWEVAIDRVHPTTFCARLSLTQLKVLQRAHLSKCRNSGIHQDVEDKCRRCH